MAVNTNIYILAVDDTRVPAQPERVLYGARILDPATMREIGKSELGAWQGYRAAIDAAVRDAIEKGNL